MPKEVVHTSQYPGEAPNPVVPVFWSRDGFVQLGVVMVDGSEDPANGLYCDLNRDQINRLVRNLRRARDQAYGRDE